MKNILKNFRASAALVLALVCGIVSSCDLTNKKDFSVVLHEVGPGYVSVMATVPAPTEVAYIIDSEPLGLTDASLIFMTGTKVTFNSDGEQQLLADIKENTKYYLYLVARLSASAYSQVYTFEFESEEFKYDELCSVVAVMTNGYKMRITVPESVKRGTPGQPGSRAIRYTQADLMFYNMNRSTYDEYYMLLYNNQMLVTEDTTVDFSEEFNVTQSTEDLNEDGKVDEKDLTYKWNPISPGEPVVFLAGEYEWMQMSPEYETGGSKEEENYSVDGWIYPAGWSAGYYLPMIDGAKYDAYYATKSATKGMNIITDIDVSHELDGYWTGAYQKKLFRTKVPEKMDAKVDMEVLEIGPVDATLAFTPDPSIEFYVLAILDDGTYEEMLKLLDHKEEYLQWATASFFAMYNFGSRQFEGDAEVVLSEHFYDVPADTKYHVLVTGMGDEAGSKQCFNHYTFNTPPKTKNRGPKIEVTALPEQSSPFEAKFLVKCTSVADNPAVRCYYGANYIKDWVYAVNSGGTYLSYGQQAQFSANELSQINSEEGLVVSFPTIDGETTRLVVVAYNDENTPNDLNYEDITECPAVADLQTDYYEADICDAYFDVVGRLAGDWTMTATVLDAKGNKVPAAKKVSILDEYSDFPASLTSEVYDIYHKHTKWTDEEIDAYWTQFKQNASLFNTKRLANQNKLALVGWIDGGVYGAYETLLPYDLFVSETISTVDVKSMFSDFGPKMYIEVSEENGKAKLTITADMMFGSPVMNWSDPFYMAGRADMESNNTIFYYADTVTGGYTAPLVFNVEYSEDFQTLTIKAIEGNGVKYYPNVIGQDSQTGRYMLDYPIVSDVVLTKGAPASQSAIKAAKKVSVDPVNAELNVSHKQYTRFGKPAQRVKMEVMTQEKAHANYAKYIRLMEKRNR